MVRTAIGIAIGILFIGTVIWSAFSAGESRCKICVDYKGRSACSTAVASDIGQAEAQAHSGACSQVSGGVTETLECANIVASVRECSG